MASNLIRSDGLQPRSDEPRSDSLHPKIAMEPNNHKPTRKNSARPRQFLDKSEFLEVYRYFLGSAA